MSDLSDDVRTLLSDRIVSFEHLEILLLLRSHRDRSWNAKDVAREVKVCSDTSIEVLDELVQGKLVRVRVEAANRQFVYGPETAVLERACDGLAEAKEQRFLDVMNFLSANAIGCVRSSAAQRMADAFRLGPDGKRKKDG